MVGMIKKGTEPRRASPKPRIVTAQEAAIRERDTRYFLASVGIAILLLIPGQTGMTGTLYVVTESILALYHPPRALTQT